MSHKQNLELKKTLKPFHLWIIGVGIVISGNYFGWNFGLAESGYVGMLIAIATMAIMYTFMCFGISELATALPHAGGPYSFARRAMGPYAGFITGIGVILEYLIAAPVVAIGIGGYINFMFPSIPSIASAVVIYALFMIVHIIGVKEYARVETVLVTVALGLLVILYFVGLPQINPERLFSSETSNSLIPGGFQGIWAALPYAMWLFLAIEMLPMLSEETENPEKDMPKGILTGVFTLLLLSFITTTVAIGLSGIDELSVMEYPLPGAVAATFGDTYWLAQVLATIGLVGLISSFSGVILAYSRPIFALSRAGYLPGFFSKLHKTRRTPYIAIILPGFIGLVLVMLFNPDDLILISTFGALVSYIAMNLSVIILRKKEPDLPRTFKTPWYPMMPAVSIVLAAIALFASFFANLTFFWISIGVFAAATIYYFAWGKKNINPEAPEEKFAAHQSKDDTPSI
ncbi:ethanolamine permease [Bacillus sp. FJAT-27251]|uniref:ethanolamine permease n=1 Tax=Bacillus sp. FJAT-27251 TaxID=1684142 RepID=UPI0006A791EC|nr:ethanolamine permease [Bacillus sp. FJAT-27251]